MRLNNKKGAILITLIVAMVLMAALGIGVYTLTTSSTFSELLSNNNDKAFELARAGIRYANNLVANQPEAYTLPETTFTMPDADHTFKIAISTAGSTKVVTSTGVVNPGSFRAASRTLTYDLAYSGVSSPIISGFGDFGPPIISNPGSPNPAITVSADKTTVTLGGNTGDAYGSIWYAGNNATCNCTSGSCDFGTGIRTYFEFTFINEDFSPTSTTFADGFTFAIMSAINNERDRTGGAPSGGPSIGELMGYAGPGNTNSTGNATTKDGLGLKPPKLALEFDTFPNDGSGNICGSDSRNDASVSGGSWHNHAALMFWGARTASGSSCVGSPNSYDDNRHNVGGGNDPLNTDHQGAGYYEGTEQLCSRSNPSPPPVGTYCRWMEDGRRYSARIEIVRPSPNNANGTYSYGIKAWIALKSVADANPLFKDVTAAYAATPQINRTVTITNTSSLNDHSAFDKMYFGFTEATGGSYQQAALTNFSLFCPTTGACTYSINPESASPGAAGATGSTVAVTAGAGCTWTAVSNAAWITITGGASGTGNGTVTYNVAANTGIARTGTMTIGGQTFTVTQASGCTYSINPVSASPGAAGATGSTVAVTAGAGCAWTAVSNAAWITITGGASGTENGTVTYNVAANTGIARTGTMTIGGQTFTVTQASGACQYVVTTQACYRTSNDRIYITATITNGPTAVNWTISGADTDSGSLSLVSGTLWGGNQSGCGLSNAARSSGFGNTGDYTVTVTATGGSCSTGSNSTTVHH